MKSLKIYSSVFILSLFIMLFACDKMDDNFSEYLEMQKTYSPKIKDLTAEAGLKEVILKWENPESDIAKYILIDYQDDSLLFDQMIDSVFIDSLDIKFYTITVYTLDEFENRSIPTSVTIFPNGEE